MARKKFTLIEILVTISIIAILAGISMVSINMSKAKAKHTRWLAYNTMLNKDPDTVLNFNFADTAASQTENNVKYPSLTNSSVGCGISGFEPKEYNGIMKGATWAMKGGRSRYYNAIQFNGKTSFVEIPGTKALDIVPEKDDFTIMMWVKFDTIASTQVLCAKAEWNTFAQYDIYLNSKRLEADVGKGSSGWTKPAIATGTWYHIAMISEGGNFQIYLNGEPMTSKVKGSPSSQSMTDRKFMLGALYTTGNKKTPRYNFQGRMDEFVLIRKALKPSEIKDHYEIGKP